MLRYERIPQLGGMAVGDRSSSTFPTAQAGFSLFSPSCYNGREGTQLLERLPLGG